MGGCGVGGVAAEAGRLSVSHDPQEMSRIAAGTRSPSQLSGDPEGLTILSRAIISTSPAGAFVSLGVFDLCFKLVEKAHSTLGFAVLGL